MTPSDLCDACDLCGGRARFDGHVHHEGGRDFAALRCRTCGNRCDVWAAGLQTALGAWTAAELIAEDPEAWLAASAKLSSGKASDTAEILRDRPEVPMWRLGDVVVDSGDVPAWTSFIAEHDRFLPAPTPLERLEELLATAIQYGYAPASVAAARFLDDVPASELGKLLRGLPSRRPAEDAGPVLVPFLEAAAGRPEVGEAVARWVGAMAATAGR
jgi:hypothetical protein